MSSTNPKEVNWIYFGSKLFEAENPTKIRPDFLENIINCMTHNSVGYCYHLWIDTRALDKVQLSELNQLSSNLPCKLQLHDVKDLNQITPEVAEPNTLEQQLYGYLLKELNVANGGNYGVASDILRLLILRHKGGIYSDLDMQIQMEFNHNLKAPKGMLAYFPILNASPKKIRGSISNCLIAFPAESELIPKLIEKILAVYEIYQQEKLISKFKFFINDRRMSELMSIAGSDVYRKILTLQMPELQNAVDFHTFIGEFCLELDFFSQAISKSTAEKICQLKLHNCDIAEHEIETALSEILASPRLMCDRDEIMPFLYTKFEKAWLPPAKAFNSKEHAPEDVLKENVSRGANLMVWI